MSNVLLQRLVEFRKRFFDSLCFEHYIVFLLPDSELVSGGDGELLLEHDGRVGQGALSLVEEERVDEILVALAGLRVVPAEEPEDAHIVY